MFVSWEGSLRQSWPVAGDRGLSWNQKAGGRIRGRLEAAGLPRSRSGGPQSREPPSREGRGESWKPGAETKLSRVGAETEEAEGRHGNPTDGWEHPEEAGKVLERSHGRSRPWPGAERLSESGRSGGNCQEPGMLVLEARMAMNWELEPWETGFRRSEAGRKPGRRQGRPGRRSGAKTVCRGRAEETGTKDGVVALQKQGAKIERRSRDEGVGMDPRPLAWGQPSRNRRPLSGRDETGSGWDARPEPRQRSSGQR